MPTAKDRLCHLLELAEEGPAQRAALVGELADLLLDWPPDWPEAMRAPVMALLEKTVRETDEETRAKLAARLGGHGELPLELVNEFYLSAPARVAPRNPDAQRDGRRRSRRAWATPARMGPRFRRRAR